MLTAQSYDAFFFTRLRHQHPALHPNHIGLVRLAHAAAFDDLDALDRELEMLTARRREILDRLSAYRRRIWPRMHERHQRRPCRDEENPLPPAPVDAAPAVGDGLRALAVAIIGRHGAVTLRELHGLIHRYGYVIESNRPVQRLADAMAYEARQGRVERVRRGVYGPVPHATSTAGESGVTLLRSEPLPWRDPVAAEADRTMDAPALVDRAVDPAVRHDPERWSGRAWPESAQAGGAWCDGDPDPFVAELAEDIAVTVTAARQRVAELYAERLGPPPPRRDPNRPQSSYAWARAYPPRTPRPSAAEPSHPNHPHPNDPDPNHPEPNHPEPAPGTPHTTPDTIGNDSSAIRSRLRADGGPAAVGSSADGGGDAGESGGDEDGRSARIDEGSRDSDPPSAAE